MFNFKPLKEVFKMSNKTTKIMNEQRLKSVAHGYNDMSETLKNLGATDSKIKSARITPRLTEAYRIGICKAIKDSTEDHTFSKGAEIAGVNRATYTKILAMLD